MAVESPRLFGAWLGTYSGYRVGLGLDFFVSNKKSQNGIQQKSPNKSGFFVE
jgi:hypothetical protein